MSDQTEESRLLCTVSVSKTPPAITIAVPIFLAITLKFNYLDFSRELIAACSALYRTMEGMSHVTYLYGATVMPQEMCARYNKMEKEIEENKIEKHKRKSAKAH